MRISLESEAAARRDLSKLLDLSETVLDGFERIAAAADVAQAGDEAYRFALELPALVGLFYYVSLPLNTRLELLQRLGFDSPARNIILQMALAMHQAGVAEACFAGFTSLQLPPNFGGKRFLVAELNQGFLRPEAREFVDELAPWFSWDGLAELLPEDFVPFHRAPEIISQNWHNAITNWSKTLMDQTLGNLLRLGFNHISRDPDILARDKKGRVHRLITLAPEDWPHNNRPQLREPTVYWCWQSRYLLQLRDHFEGLNRAGQWEVEGPEAIKKQLGPLYPQADPVHQARCMDIYREKVLLKAAGVRFIGFPQNTSKANRDLEELFVPRKFKTDHDDIDLRQLLTHKRVLVLGDPGMGKSTLCNFLAVEAARHPHSPILTATGKPLFLLIRLRDYGTWLQAHRDGDLLGYWTSHLRNDHDLELPKEFWQFHLAMGHCRLLLDGLDEVGRLRAYMVKDVVALMARFPGNGCLITSRPAGYQEAPLPKKWAETVQLQPFEDADIDEFVQHWYTTVEEEAKERKEGIEELCQAIRENPGIRALARNPLLLTLIALIHRYEAVLPQERHVLYEKCTELLLQSWVRAKDKGKGLEVYTEIPLARQRTMLEDLAFYRMNVARGDWTPTFTKAEVFQVLKGKADDQALARWLEYIKTRSGLLVEIQPDHFQFLHLTLMEYMCAKALPRKFSSKFFLAKFLVKQIAEYGHWRETGLLSLGIQIEDEKFIKYFQALLRFHIWRVRCHSSILKVAPYAYPNRFYRVGTNLGMFLWATLVDEDLKRIIDLPYGVLASNITNDIYNRI